VNRRKPALRRAPTGGWPGRNLAHQRCPHQPAGTPASKPALPEPALRWRLPNCATLNSRQHPTHHWQKNPVRGDEYLTDHQIIAGIGFTMENYRFIDETTVAPVTTTTKSIPVEYRELAPYIGAVFPLPNELLVTAIYGYSWSSNSLVTDTANSKSKLSEKTVGHYADLGIERPFDCSKFLDEVTPRCGFIYVLGDNRSRDKYELPNEIDNKTNEAANGSLGAHVGLGLTKGVATFDASCELASWSSGILTGPSVFSASVTVDFKKNDKVSNRGGAKADAGYSAPAAPAAYTPAEETPAPATGGSFDF